MKRVLQIAALAITPTFASAAFNSDSVGTSTANFLKLEAGARAVAMGDAYSALSDDASSLYWNPAGMTRVEDHSLVVMHAPYLASTFYDYAAYARRRERQAFGVAIQYFSAGRLDQTDLGDTPLGSFSPYDLALTAGYGYRLTDEGDAVGFSGKWIHSKIIASASAVALDLGAQSRVFWDRAQFAFTVTNLGSQMKFEQASEKLPTALRLGSGWALSSHWTAAVDFNFPRDNGAYTALGTEYAWPLNNGCHAAARLGYNALTAGDVSGVTGLAFGAGFAWRQAAVDYAFLPYGGLGLTHRISIAFRWGDISDDNANLQRSPHRYYSPQEESNLP